MMVGNNDRIQGIISQLEEACRAVEVRVRLLQRLLQQASVCASTHLPVETTSTNCFNVSSSQSLSAFFSVTLRGGHTKGKKGKLVFWCHRVLSPLLIFLCSFLPQTPDSCSAPGALTMKEAVKMMGWENRQLSFGLCWT